MFTFIIILLIIVSFLLGAVVLVQNSKGGGLAAGLSASNQVMGVRKTTDFLEKLTWVFAIMLIVLALVGNLVLPKNAASGDQSVIEEQLNDVAVPTAPAPAAPAPGAAPAGQQPATPAE
jgi:preprotein translocase subunit SecG